MEDRLLGTDQMGAWRALQVMSTRLETALTHQLVTESGLSYPDYLVLAALSETPGERLRLFELATALGWERSRVSHQVSRMVDRGLVRKGTSPTDRRGSDVALTAKGRRKHERAAPAHLALVRRLVVDRLAPDQLAAVGRAAEAVLAALDEPVDQVEARRASP